MIDNSHISPLVTLQNVGLKLSGKQLLNHINFSVLPYKFVTIIGPNGAGKTTLIRLLLGLITPSEGSVKKKEGLKIGYMPQKFTVDRSLPLTVERFLTLSSNKLKLMPVLEEVGVPHLLNQSIHVLSGGEFQRILLARSLLMAPELLVLDEPLQGVDINGQAELYQLILDIQKRFSCAVLLVSHDLHFVHIASDQVICLNQHICCVGTPKEIQKNPEYLNLFGRYVPEGLVLYKHDTGHDHSHGQDPTGHSHG